MNPNQALWEKGDLTRPLTSRARSSANSLSPGQKKHRMHKSKLGTYIRGPISGLHARFEEVSMKLRFGICLFVATLFFSGPLLAQRPVTDRAKAYASAPDIPFDSTPNF